MRVDRVLVRVLALALIVPLACADPGDTTKHVATYIVGPLTYLIAAVGVLACLYKFARGDKSAAFFILGGMLFLALANKIRTDWFANPGQFQLGTVASLEFPVYGQTPAVRMPGETVTYDVIRAWGYIGVMCLSSILDLMYRLGFPIAAVGAGALWTYWRIAVKHEAGSVISYVVGCVAIGGLCLVPSVTFIAHDVDDLEKHDVIKTFTTLNHFAPQGSLEDPSRLSIPLLPALVLIGGTDLSEAIGAAINRLPRSSLPGQMITAARSFKLPSGFLAEYEEFAAQCAASRWGFVQAEPDTKTAQFSTQMVGEAPRVRAASKNYLSAWGDALLAWIPVDGYAINSMADWESVQEIDEPRRGKVSKLFRWTPINMPSELKYTAMITGDGIGSGQPGAGSFSAVTHLDSGLFRNQALVYTLPDRTTTTLRPTPAIALFYCSTEIPNGAFDVASFDLAVAKAGTGPIEVDGFPTLRKTGIESEYLENAIIASSPMPTAQATITVMPIDWSESLRKDLLSECNPAACHSSCGDVTNKAFWGCLVTGQFIALSRESICSGSADLTRAFYGEAVGGDTYDDFGSHLSDALWGASDSVKQRSFAALRAAAIAGTPTSDYDGMQRRAAVDLIFAAPGAYEQNLLAEDAANLPRSTPGAFGMWQVFASLPNAVMPMLSACAQLASALITYMWPHVMGLTLVLFLLMYPLFAILSLIPGKWVVMLDWIRRLLWVLLWPPIVSLGFALISSASYLSSKIAFLSATAGPGESLLKLLGSALIIMSPAIAQAAISPGFASLGNLGISVYGTAFKVLGIVGSLATMVGGASTVAAAVAVSSAPRAGLALSAEVEPRRATALGDGRGNPDPTSYGFTASSRRDISRGQLSNRAIASAMLATVDALAPAPGFAQSAGAASGLATWGTNDEGLPVPSSDNRVAGRASSLHAGPTDSRDRPSLAYGVDHALRPNLNTLIAAARAESATARAAGSGFDHVYATTAQGLAAVDTLQRTAMDLGDRAQLDDIHLSRAQLHATNAQTLYSQADTIDRAAVLRGDISPGSDSKANIDARSVRARARDASEQAIADYRLSVSPDRSVSLRSSGAMTSDDDYRSTLDKLLLDCERRSQFESEK